MISSLAVSCFRDLDYKLFLYGSRARDDAKFYSDVDLAVEFSPATTQQLRAKTLGNFAEALEESTLPYFVDLVDLEQVDNALRGQIDAHKLAI